MTTIKTIEPNGIRFTRSDGKSILVADIGRCIRVYGPGRNDSLDVSHNFGHGQPYLAIRRLFALDRLPIMDIHA